MHWRCIGEDDIVLDICFTGRTTINSKISFSIILFLLACLSCKRPFGSQDLTSYFSCFSPEPTKSETLIVDQISVSWNGNSHKINYCSLFSIGATINILQGSSKSHPNNTFKCSCLHQIYNIYHYFLVSTRNALAFNPRTWDYLVVPLLLFLATNFCKEPVVAWVSSQQISLIASWLAHDATNILMKQVIPLMRYAACFLFTCLPKSFGIWWHLWPRLTFKFQTSSFTSHSKIPFYEWALVKLIDNKHSRKKLWTKITIFSFLVLFKWLIWVYANPWSVRLFKLITPCHNLLQKCHLLIELSHLDIGWNLSGDLSCIVCWIFPSIFQLQLQLTLKMCKVSM